MKRKARKKLLITCIRSGQRDLISSNRMAMTGIFPLTRHINNMLVADAVLIYKGDCPMDWLNSKIRDLVKAPGYGKSKPFRAIEIISQAKNSR